MPKKLRAIWSPPLPNDVFTYGFTCTECEGYGMIKMEICKKCNGQGHYIPSDEEMDSYIENVEKERNNNLWKK